MTSSSTPQWSNGSAPDAPFRATPTCATLSEGLRELLGDDATRAGAKAMAIVIAGYGGASDAVGEIERVAGK